MKQPLVPLGDFAEVLSGFAFKSNWFQDEGTKVIRIGDIENKRINPDSCVYVDSSKHKIPESCKARKLDILMALSGATTGKIGIVDQDLDGTLVNQRVAIVRADNVVTQKYLRYFFSGHFLERLLNQAWGAAQANLSPKALRQLEIPLPSIAEQRRIATILDKADAIRRKRKQAIQYTEELLRATFLDMFGDLASRNWDMTTVERVVKNHKGAIRTGPFGSQLLHSEFVDSGIAVLGIDNAVNNHFVWAKPRFISQEKYNKLKRYKVYPEDVIITIMGTCGRCAIVPHDCPEAINTKHLCCVTLDQEKCLPEFLHAYFLIHPKAREYLDKNAKGAVMDGLNMGIIKKIPVLLPPLNLQQKYKAVVESFGRLKSEMQNRAQQEEDLFNSLLQRAFRGEL